jgi:hypothetical protein
VQKPNPPNIAVLSLPRPLPYSSKQVLPIHLEIHSQTGFKVFVERSDQRIFDDAEFSA